jgi:hypothetical protein
MQPTSATAKSSIQYDRICALAARGVEGLRTNSRVTGCVRMASTVIEEGRANLALGSIGRNDLRDPKSRDLLLRPVVEPPSSAERCCLLASAQLVEQPLCRWKFAHMFVDPRSRVVPIGQRPAAHLTLGGLRQGARVSTNSHPKLNPSSVGE